MAEDANFKNLVQKQSYLIFVKMKFSGLLRFLCFLYFIFGAEKFLYFIFSSFFLYSPLFCDSSSVFFAFILRD